MGRFLSAMPNDWHDRDRTLQRVRVREIRLRCDFLRGRAPCVLHATGGRTARWQPHRWRGAYDADAPYCHSVRFGERHCRVLHPKRLDAGALSPAVAKLDMRALRYVLGSSDTASRCRRSGDSAWWTELSRNRRVWWCGRWRARPSGFCAAECLPRLTGTAAGVNRQRARRTFSPYIDARIGG